MSASDPTSIAAALDVKVEALDAFVPHVAGEAFRAALAGDTFAAEVTGGVFTAGGEAAAAFVPQPPDQNSSPGNCDV